MIILNLTEEELDAINDGILNNMDHYECGESGWLYDYLMSMGYNPQNSNMFFKKIDFKMDEEEPADSDLENAILLYETMDKDVAPYVASSGAFWTAVVHGNLEYMAYRWPIEPDWDNSKKEEYIQQKYVMKWSTSRRERRHNGLSRLWWIVYLTVDNNNADKYELTREIVGNQELLNQILDREAFNPTVSRALLKAIKIERLAGTEVSRKELRDLTKYIFTLDRSIVLYALTEDEITEKLRDYLKWYRSKPSIELQ